LASVNCPILYLRASSDRLVPRRAGELIRSISPNTRLSEIRGPHMLLQTQPVESARIIRGFCEQRLVPH
jgi:pimeloyl-[acyl-carrier protein] methyl ester esterase